MRTDRDRERDFREIKRHVSFKPSRDISRNRAAYANAVTGLIAMEIAEGETWDEQVEIAQSFQERFTLMGASYFDGGGEALPLFELDEEWAEPIDLAQAATGKKADDPRNDDDAQVGRWLTLPHMMAPDGDVEEDFKNTVDATWREKIGSMDGIFL